MSICKELILEKKKELEVNVVEKFSKNLRWLMSYIKIFPIPRISLQF